MAMKVPLGTQSALSRGHAWFTAWLVVGRRSLENASAGKLPESFSELPGNLSIWLKKKSATIVGCLPTTAHVWSTGAPSFSELQCQAQPDVDTAGMPP